MAAGWRGEGLKVNVMSTQNTVQAKYRTENGSAHARRLRSQGIVPAVIYGKNSEGEVIQVSEYEFGQQLRGRVGEHGMMDLTVEGGKVRKVLLKEVQHHPLTGRIQHLDFHEVSLTEKVHIMVPIELIGTPVGVAQEGGTLDHLLREVEIECLPGEIPGHLEVDVSALGIGDSLFLKDLEVDSEKVSLIADLDIAFAHVSAPRIIDEDEPETEGGEIVEGEGGAAPTEPEVLTEKSREDSEE